MQMTAARATHSVFTLPLVGRVARRSVAKADGVGVVQRNLDGASYENTHHPHPQPLPTRGRGADRVRGEAFALIAIEST
jgi:hypothetical protein